MSVMATAFVCGEMTLTASFHCHSFGPVGLVHFYCEHDASNSSRGLKKKKARQTVNAYGVTCA